MLLEGRVKRVALLTAVDICLRKTKSSPKRCARNLIELGLSAYPDKISAVEQNLLFEHMLLAFEKGDIAEVRDIFSTTFL